MSMRYTANEMRELAEMIDHGGAFALTDPSIVEANVAMLRQAAEDLEREKKYEYAVEYHDSGKWVVYKDGLTLVEAQKLSSEKWICRHRIIRREVGEWEDVDGAQSHKTER